MNWLRLQSAAGGGLVAVLSLWAMGRYADGTLDWSFLLPLGLGIAVVALPTVAAHAKRLGLRVHRTYEERSQPTTFVSTTPVDDGRATLADVAETLQSDPSYDAVSFEDASGPPRLTVRHDEVHASFVELTGERLVVTGLSTDWNRELAEDLEAACSVPMDEAASNPLRGRPRVTGAPRMLLGLLVVTGVLLGVVSVADAAYPSDAYNPAEKTVLVSLDARETVDPRFSTTEARLSKVAFLVRVLEEVPTEVQWANESNATAERSRIRDARRVAADAEELLQAVHEGSTTSAQRQRARRLAADLRAAERRLGAVNASVTVVDVNATTALSASRSRPGRLGRRTRPVPWGARGPV